MKPFIIILFSIFAGIGSLSGKNLEAYLSYAIFNTPDNKPYIETYLVVSGQSAVYALQPDGTFQAQVDVQIIFRENDSIINYDKYELKSPKIKDTTKFINNMLNVERYALPNGNYQIELTINDKNSDEEPLTSTDEFVVDYTKDKISFSDIELVHSYQKSDEGGLLEKNGYEIVPYAISYYPEVAKNLTFYSELYNVDSLVGGNQFLLYYYIRPVELDKKFDQYFFAKKQNGKRINILLNSINISDLPSGRYLLVLEARDRNNQVIASRQKYFYRFNPGAEYNYTSMLALNTNNSFASQITSKDTLLQYIDYLYPISTEPEKNFAKSLFKEADLQTLQKYFLNFWLQRNNTQPAKAWQAYKLLVDQVNHDYNALRIKGYKTDRGRVYLQYGPPNVVSKSYNEPAGYPYEIWQYYTLGNQRDKRFVFYTKDLSTNDFLLIHSTAVGELHNNQWQKYIYSRTWNPLDIDDVIIPSTYGSFATDYYLQPR